MNPNYARCISGCTIVLAISILISGTQAAAMDMPALVAKPYPGSVSEYTREGKPATCGDNEEAYCFLTRDPVEKVSAFYAQQGIKLKTVSAKERAEVGDGMSNFEFGLHQVSLEVRPSELLVAPLEFYQTKGADDDPSYFNALIIETKAKSAPLKTDEQGKQAIIENMALGHFALSPISKIMMPTYGNIYMEPALLVPHYNRHLSLWSGYLRQVDGEPVTKLKYVELHPTWVLAAASDGGGNDAKEEEMRKELKEILARKPDKKREYQSLRRSAHDKEARKKLQPELDKILMSDPELAAWKKRSDALEKQSNSGAAQSNRAVTNEDVEAYLQALEKEVYYTRILIHISEGRRVSRDPAKIQSEWGHH